jgi:hypothetical protein
MKVVINARFGGFSLSKEAYKGLGLKWDEYGLDYNDKEKRCDPNLVKVVEKLGKRADGSFASLKVVDIPDDMEWEIEEYDGWESIHEKHRVWR